MINVEKAHVPPEYRKDSVFRSWVTYQSHAETLCDTAINLEKKTIFTWNLSRFLSSRLV